MRKDKLVVNEIYHIYNKSIADFIIYNREEEFLRMLSTIGYYRREEPKISFSRFLRDVDPEKDHSESYYNPRNKRKLVEIIAYCLMPTHFHLILKQFTDNGISIFMSNLQNSYARYFNLKHKRKGPLWEGRFKSVLIKTDTQLIHLTRYIHLNPATSRLVNDPEKWLMSSYNEYLAKTDENKNICNYHGVLDIEPVIYKKFVEDRLSYQRELAKIKGLLLEPQPC